MHRKATLGWLTGLMIAVAIIGVGCSGSDGGDEIPPPARTGTLNGQIVAANDTSLVIPNAVVTIAEANRTATTGADGGFVFADLPVGSWTVSVTTPQSEQLGNASANVPISADATTVVSLAVLPLDIAAPEKILIDPTSITLDINGRIAYRAQIVGPGNQTLTGIEPTWVVDGGVGRITPQGVFTAEREGQGAVKAYSGNAVRSSTVNVVGSRPPEISSLRVNPQSLPATGGEILISAAVRDGDGINPQDVIAEILLAGDEPIRLEMQVSNPGSAIRCPNVPDCFVDASFEVNYQVPVNDNRPTEDGIQARQTYSVSVRVRDRSGAASRSDFVEFVVQGIDPPPVRPRI